MNYRLRFVILKADAIKSQKVAKKGLQKSRTLLLFIISFVQVERCRIYRKCGSHYVKKESFYFTNQGLLGCSCKVEFINCCENKKVTWNL